MSRYEENFELTPDGEPLLEFNMRSDNEVIPLSLDWETTAIFTHRQEFRDYDHIFVQMEKYDEEENERYSALGAFIWRQVIPDWEDLREALDKRDYHHIHKPYPSPEDVEQYKASGLIPPSQNFVKAESGLLLPEVKVIEEVEDDDVVSKVMEKIDHELNWFLNDPHFYDRIKPRKDDGEK